MKSSVLSLLAFLSLGLTVSNCGDDDDGSSVDNVAECHEAEDAYNDLSCASYDMDLECDNYADSDCDYSEYFDCLEQIYSCDGDNVVVDNEKSSECVDILYEISDGCSGDDQASD